MSVPAHGRPRPSPGRGPTPVPLFPWQPLLAQGGDAGRQPWRPVYGENPSPAEPSMAATPRSRQLSEQVPPRQLQELMALDDRAAKLAAVPAGESPAAHHGGIPEKRHLRHAECSIGRVPAVAPDIPVIPASRPARRDGETGASEGA
jgi:hypothetical protein